MKNLNIKPPCGQVDCTLNIVGPDNLPIKFDPDFCSTCTDNPNIEVCSWGHQVPKVIQDMNGLCAYLQCLVLHQGKALSFVEDSILERLFPWSASARRKEVLRATMRERLVFMNELMHKCNWAAPNDCPR